MAATRGQKMQADIMTVLREQDHPQTAYALLEQLRSDNPKLAPTSIYRALAALSKRGEIHRLESKNAFVACKHGKHADAFILAICEDCGAVEEHITPCVIEDLSKTARKSGFKPTRHVIEVYGHCATCGAEGGPI